MSGGPLYSAGACVAVGAVWGATNPFIRRGSLAVAAKRSRSRPAASWLAGWAGAALTCLTTPSFLVPQLLNQAGSIAFVALLAGADLSLAVPLVNASSLAANALADLALGERYRCALLAPGLALVALGLALCATGR